jgi:hypothetical protein
MVFTGSVPVGSVPAGTVSTGLVPVGSVSVGAVPTGSVPAGVVPSSNRVKKRSSREPAGVPIGSTLIRGPVTWPGPYSPVGAPSPLNSMVNSAGAYGQYPQRRFATCALLQAFP